MFRVSINKDYGFKVYVYRTGENPRTLVEASGLWIRNWCHIPWFPKCILLGTTSETMRSWAKGSVNKSTIWSNHSWKKHKQNFIINRAESNWTTVESGIPQGSILGPIIFNFFVNDMPGGTVCQIILFADYVNLFYNVTTEYNCKLIKEWWITNWETERIHLCHMSCPSR